MRDWLVAADDRTGALETAAEIARVAGSVTVTVGGVPEASGVVDLGTRVLDAADAAAMVRALWPARWRAHKMDSTLRGNWAAEVRALDARVVLVPAWPLMGRTCRGGVVHVHGTPLAAVRDQLPETALLADVDALQRWLGDGDGRFAAVDVATTDDMVAVAAALRAHDVVVAGPAGPIGACFAARFGGGVAEEPPSLEGSVLVVCGSATDVSREQLRRLRAERPDIEVLDAPPVDGHLDIAIARSLAERAADWEVDTLVVIGGDTAAAVLGDAPRRVGGTVAPGMPWSRDTHGGGPVVITKAGSFGDPDALVWLFSRETE